MKNSSNSFRPKKSFGQNFLINPHVQERIVSACQLKQTDTVVEIGPGKGAITKLLIDKVDNLIVIEKDKYLVKTLQNQFDQETITIIGRDFLKIELETLPKNAIIIGNLPYNIATAIIQKILKFNTKAKHFHHLYFMVQLEHGRRMTALPSTKQYGAFTCLVQFYANPSILFKIGNSSFSPKPKVQSCFMHIELPKKPKYKFDDPEFLFKIIHAAFNQRRKTIQNSLSSLSDKPAVTKLLDKLQISPQARAENLSIENFIDIAKSIRKLS